MKSETMIASIDAEFKPDFKVEGTSEAFDELPAALTQFFNEANESLMMGIKPTLDPSTEQYVLTCYERGIGQEEIAEVVLIPFEQKIKTIQKLECAKEVAKNKKDNKSVAQYEKQIKSINLRMNKFEETILWKAYQSDLHRNRILDVFDVVFHPLLHRVALDFKSKNCQDIPLDELYGQVRAVFIFLIKDNNSDEAIAPRSNASDFDPEKGNLGKYIMGRCLLILHEYLNFLQGKSGYDVKSQNKIVRFQDSFYVENGRYPTEEELKAGIGFSDKKLKQVREVSMRQNEQVSLSEARTNVHGDGVTNLDILEANYSALSTVSAEEEAFKNKKNTDILRAVAKLKNKDNYFDICIDRYEGKSKVEMAAKYGVEVYEITKCINEIKDYLKDELSDYAGDINLEFLAFS